MNQQRDVRNYYTKNTITYWNLHARFDFRGVREGGAYLVNQSGSTSPSDEEALCSISKIAMRVICVCRLQQKPHKNFVYLVPERWKSTMWNDQGDKPTDLFNSPTLT